MTTRKPAPQKLYLYEVHVNGKRIGTYKSKFQADTLASEALFGTDNEVKVLQIKHPAGPGFDIEGNTVIVDARGYGRRV